MCPQNSAGLKVGTFLALLKFVWVLLVFYGWAQGFLDFLFRLNFITPCYTIQLFDAMNAGKLVLMAFVGGYALGWVFSSISRLFDKKIQ